MDIKNTTLLRVTQHRLIDVDTEVESVHLGAHSAGEIPVPIPNTEVKPSRGDYTATSGKLARCQIIRVSHPDGWLFVSPKPLFSKSNRFPKIIANIVIWQYIV